MRTLASLRLDDWRVLAEAWFTLLAVKIALHTVDFKRLMAWAARVDTPVVTEPSVREVRRIGWLVEVASRVTFLRCLPRSLALTRILARRGIESTMRIGVQTHEGVLKAHAWVEWRGQALNDDEHSLRQFAAFDSLQGGVSNA